MKKLLAFLKQPPLAFRCAVWLAAVLCIAGAFVCIAFGYEEWPAYVVFAAAAITLAYSVYLLVRGVSAVKAKVIEQAKRHKFTNNFISDYSFRSIALFSLSFVINVGYALMNGVLGIVMRAVWYGVFAAYYLLLSALRCGILVGSHRAKKRAGEDGALLSVYRLKLYRLCGISLFVLEIALAAAVTLMVLSERPTPVSEVMAITSAAYTFYKIISAVVNLAKARRLQDPLLLCFRNINLADAAVSVLSLQVTLVAVFSDEIDFSMSLLNIFTGFVVCALTVCLGIAMIASANGRLKKLRLAAAEGAEAPSPEAESGNSE